MNPALGAGGGASVSAPGDCIARFLAYRRQRVKEVSGLLYDRFYIPRRVLDFPVSYSMVAGVCGYSDKAVVRELEAISRLLGFEFANASTYLEFLELYINARFDPVDGGDYRREVELLRNLLTIYEKEYEERKVEEVVTKSGKRLHLKVKDGRVIASGDTYHVKDELKKLGFKWDPVERVWYAPANTDISSVMAKLAEV